MKPGHKVKICKSKFVLLCLVQPLQSVSALNFVPAFLFKIYLTYLDMVFWRDPLAKKGIQEITDQMQDIILGQSDVVRFVLCALFAGGNVLLEGVPGVGKTLIGLTLARLLDLSFRRIQFTNDLLPSDIMGFHDFRKGVGEPELMKGPVFASIVLVDEINRTSPKTQSALLEAMEERQVTIDGISYPLPEPFMVIATQNPIEVVGTFPLPESQLDRFLLKVKVSYPPLEHEKQILLRSIDHKKALNLKPVIGMDLISDMIAQAAAIKVHDDILGYMTSIIRATRVHPKIELGVSPRGGLALKRASQAFAFISDRDFVTPADVRKVSVPVLAHRVLTRSASPENVIEDILREVQAPL
jgi:MoxR-like ATPase